MIKLGQWVILTRNELIETVNDERALGYRAGLRSKWKTKKDKTEYFTKNPLARGVITTPIGQPSAGINEIQSLLSAVDNDIILPQREDAA